jgi:hypothetical protein
MTGWIEINEMKHELSFFIALKYSSSKWYELVQRKRFKADLNCLVLSDKFLVWEES